MFTYYGSQIYFAHWIYSDEEDLLRHDWESELLSKDRTVPLQMKDAPPKSRHRLVLSLMLMFVFTLSTTIPSQAVSTGSKSISIAQLSNALDLINAKSLLAQDLLSQIDSSNSKEKIGLNRRLVKAQSTLLSTKKTFISGVGSALKANPESLKLLKDYALSFKQVNDVQASLSSSLITLQIDQSLGERIKKALSAVTGGGQSDMNAELGANREKLRQLALKVAADHEVIKLEQSEITLAQGILNTAESRALADPLASLAIMGQMHYLITAPDTKVDMSQPINWFWGNLKQR